MSYHKEDYVGLKDKAVDLMKEYPKVTFLILGIVFGSITVLLLA